MTDFPHMKSPCSNCPWRLDSTPEEFDVERYRRLAASAYDLSSVLFACHKTPEGREAACAGFLLCGADHNLAVRFAVIQGRYDPADVSSEFDLYENYRELAEANGVDEDDAALRPCR